MNYMCGLYLDYLDIITADLRFLSTLYQVIKLITYRMKLSKDTTSEQVKSVERWVQYYSEVLPP